MDTAGRNQLALGLRTVLDLLERAELARDTVAADPQHAHQLAISVLASLDVGAEARAVALRALGLAEKFVGNARSAERTLREAIRTADAAELPRRVAEAQLSLVLVLVDRGLLEEALEVAQSAGRVLRGADLANLHAQRGLVLIRAGRHAEALQAFRTAIPTLEKADDAEWLWIILNNRSLALTYLGRFDAARNDLIRARTIADSSGLDLYAGFARHNLGFVSLMSGDVPSALRLFTEAEAEFPTTGQAKAVRLLDLAEAYTNGRLFHEARESLEQAVDTFRDGGFAVDVAEAQVLLARTHLLEGDAASAARVATDATAELSRQRRPGWTVLAEHLALNARVLQGERTDGLLSELRRSSRRLASWGWSHAAVHSRVLAGELASGLGNKRVARTELERAAAARHRGPIAVRAPAWYAAALRRLVDGDERGALRAAGAGLRAVDDYAATLGATDLRVRASGWGEDLASLGVRLTRDSGDAWRYLTWVERWRANALRRPLVQPPHDARLAHDLAELRRVTSEIATGSARGDDTRSLLAEQLRLERAIRDRSRVVSGPAGRSTANRLDRGELRSRLGERALLELTDYHGTLVAVTFVDGRTRMRELCPADPVTAEMESLRFFLHRLARKHGSSASLTAAGDGVTHSTNELDAMLLAPLRADLGDRDLVLTPTGALHALPWSVLPTLRGRPLSVAPSATVWLAAARRLSSRRRSRRIVTVAGPGLTHAQAEVRAVARHHEDAKRLTGRRATVQATLDALDGADVAHLAAHGTFRADNPQFSNLDLFDGPLTVYDLERIRRAPRRLVLSACDTALSAVHPGDELQGVAAAFFALGTGTLVASVSPVADDETRTLMGRFHRYLAAGRSPDRALADAGTTTGTLGFVCFGASD